MIKTDPKKERLISLLNQYLYKPNLKMKNVIRNIVNRLIQHNSMTENQFNSVIKFLEREKEFRNMSRSQIKNYFQHLINNNKYSKEIVNESTNDLTQFFI